MEGTYDILMGKEPVGQARVTRQGLYYRFDCRCRLSGEVICRVTVCVGGHHENLGILVPNGDAFTLCKKLPVKGLGTGFPEFRALPRHHKTQGTFVAVYPEEPFQYLTRLQNAYLEVRNAQQGIVLNE